MTVVHLAADLTVAEMSVWTLAYTASAFSARTNSSNSPRIDALIRRAGLARTDHVGRHDGARHLTGVGHAGLPPPPHRNAITPPATPSRPKWMCANLTGELRSL